jgi:hypothetical protein
LVKTAQFLDIQVKQFAGSGALVADHRRPGWVEGREAVETVTAEDAGESGFGDGEGQEDLGVGTALAAQGEDLCFEVGRGFARLDQGYRGVIFQARREALGLGALEPFADGFLGDGKGLGGGPERRAFREVMVDQFSSHERGESGISVHVGREVWQAAGNQSTTDLPEPVSADNVLKHDT